jgi:YHS domain-containing protein
MKNKAFILLMILVMAWPGLSQASLRVKHFNLEKGLALQGYDPVAYFTQNKPIKGKSGLEYNHEGITYRFSSPANLDLFKQDPHKYEPQYGGWCAYAMGATNEKVEIDPETFKIVNGKLYLFYHSWINNTLLKWNDDETVLRTNADKNWKNIYK